MPTLFPGLDSLASHTPHRKTFSFNNYLLNSNSGPNTVRGCVIYCFSSSQHTFRPVLIILVIQMDKMKSETLNNQYKATQLVSDHAGSIQADWTQRSTFLQFFSTVSKTINQKYEKMFQKFREKKNFYQIEDERQRMQDQGNFLEEINGKLQRIIELKQEIGIMVLPR